MIANSPSTAMKELANKLAAEIAGLQTQVTSFPSGSVMLDVNRDGRAWVMAYSPAHGFGVDQLHSDDGFTTGFQFVCDQFEAAARRLSELTHAEYSSARPTIALIVLHVHDIEKSKAFYSLLGLSFSEEKHGAGPRHYAAVLDGLVFEIYPCRANVPVSPLRIGFHVVAVDDLVEGLRAHDIPIVNEPNDSPWGRRAVVADPDGNRVELSVRLAGRNP
jgi:lactoylglutathione lyase